MYDLIFMKFSVIVEQDLIIWNLFSKSISKLIQRLKYRILEATILRTSAIVVVVVNFSATRFIFWTEYVNKWALKYRNQCCLFLSTFFLCKIIISIFFMHAIEFYWHLKAFTLLSITPFYAFYWRGVIYLQGLRSRYFRHRTLKSIVFW